MRYPDFKDVLARLGMSKFEIEKLLSNFNEVSFSKDEHILDIGNVFDDVYILMHGAFRLYYLTPEGNESNKLFLFEQDIAFPIAPIAQKKPSLFGIIACENSCALRIPYKSFKAILTQQGLWQQFYLVYLEWLVDTKIAREHRLLTLNKTEIIEDLANEEPKAYSRIHDYHLASYLGMSPVTFSRLRNRS